MIDRVEKLKEFLKQSPDDAFLNHALALEYIKLGNDEDAKKLFENNIEKHSGYIATYYHLAKLLERKGLQQQALHIYERGMLQAKQAGDMHTYSELQAAYEDIVY